MQEWPAPVIAAPPSCEGQVFSLYVPNNDLDAVGGDPARVNELRTAKTVRPRLFDPAIPFLYLWRPEGEDPDPAQFVIIAERLYQLGRGIDMAFATAEWLTPEEAEARLAAHPGPVFRPSETGSAGRVLACPGPHALASLLRRHAAQAERFQKDTRRGQLLFIQPPKPRFRQVAYDCPPHRLVFALRRGDAYEARPLADAVALVEQARDAAARRLIEAGHPSPETIERLLIGRGAAAADLPLRPRIVPLPSIGATHADHAIRRLLLEIPRDCPLRADDLEWAFSGLPVGAARLVPAEAGDRMINHYLPESGARRWRSVTPVALPWPRRRSEGGRIMREAAAAAALRQALRHAGITAAPEAIRLQQEPLAVRGRHARNFAHPPRFPAERLVHAELRFTAPQTGPLVIGDGRFLGLGLFAPVREAPDILAFAIRGGLRQPADADTLARALRRAAMARVQVLLGRAPLPGFFSGHAPDGEPLRGGDHRHLAFAFDPERHRLVVIAPHRLEARAPMAEERSHLDLLDSAMADFAELRAGAAGLLRLMPEDLADDDPLLAPAQVWESLTAYRPTRYVKRCSAAEALAADVRAECRRREWPAPEVQVLKFAQGPRGGLAGWLRLLFAQARPGPIVLGRTAHLGGGLFRAVG
jgi:CRISPR-associated protein Csb2